MVLFSEPMVSVVIAAHNEEANIKSRIENIMTQDYPETKLEIIVVSDGSTDSTNKVVDEICGRTDRLKLIKYEHNMGKSYALNQGVSQASGELIVFTDARQQFEKNAVKELIANFNDPEVGCVSGELVFHKESTSAIKSQMQFYWGFEKTIRKMESATGSVAGATGAICAVRKSLYKPLPADVLLDDVLIPMNVVFQGYRNIFDSHAIAYDVISRDMSQEKQRKIRTLLGNWQLLKIVPRLLSPTGNPIFIRYLSHKILRLALPFFTILLVLASFMSAGFIYKAVLAIVVIAVLLSFACNRLAGIRYLNTISKLANTFVSMHYFALLSFFLFLRPGERKIWK